MLYLLLAVACSAMISVGMRLSEGRASGKMGMLAVNYAVCVAVAGGCMGAESLLPAGQGTALTVGLGLLSGLLYLLGFVLLQYNVRANGVVLSATFMKLGLLVPMALSVFLFGEMPGPAQSVGFGLAVFAIVLINFEKGSGAGGAPLALVLLLLAGGGADAMSKVFERLGPAELSDHFLLYTFAAALVLCLALMLARGERPGVWDAVFGALVGVPNYFSARFLLLALTRLRAVIVYPTYSVATIVAVTLAGVLLFRERLAGRQWLALAVILAALVLLNL